MNNIRWECSYTMEDGSFQIVRLLERGREVKFTAKDLEMCGRELTFYAYINKKSEKNGLKVFHHYRFRWFDRKEFLDKVKKENYFLGRLHKMTQIYVVQALLCIC